MVLPRSALRGRDQVAVVDAVACEACGACTMACPNKAAQQYGFSPKQFLLGLDELLG